jgi:hypothetical protein
MPEVHMNNRACSQIGTLLLLTFLQPALAQEESSTRPIVVIDLRPDEEKQGAGLTALEGKCNKNVFRVADVASDPLKVDILKQDLAQRMSVGGEGKTLAVLNWGIYYNKQVNEGGGFLKNIGVQGYEVPGAGKSEGKQPGSKCPKKESAGGWYEKEEVTGIYFPLISEFTGTYGGKPVNVRVVYSPSRKIEGKFEGGERDTAALLEVVQQTTDQVAAVVIQ